MIRNSTLKGRNIFIVSLLLFPALAAPAPHARAETYSDALVLKNGDRISGEMLGSNRNGMILFDTPYGQTLEIPAADIQSFQPAQRAATYKLAPAGAAKTQQVKEADPPVSEPDSAARDPEADESTTENKIWSGQINAGASLDDGNSNKKDIALDGEASARFDKNRIILGGKFNWAEEEDAITENDSEISAEYDRFLTEKWFAGGRVKFQTDDIEKLDLRSRYGLFSGYQFYEREDLNLAVRAGADYIREEFENTETESDIAASWALDYEQSFLDQFFRAFHNHDLSVPVDETDAFLFESNSGVRIPVGEHLTSTAEISFDWDNKPPPGIREEDTTYSLKLGYDW